tara:strand:+ start:15219 stop:15461 length:243 start_codon:yes stop_codon:yes gene_type:complete
MFYVASPGISFVSCRFVKDLSIILRMSHLIITPQYILFSKLENAELKNAELQDISYHSDTIWPEGFDPTMSGARLVTHQE